MHWRLFTGWIVITMARIERSNLTTATSGSRPSPRDATTASGSLLGRTLMKVFEAPEPADELLKLARPVRAGRFD